MTHATRITAAIAALAAACGTSSGGPAPPQAPEHAIDGTDAGSGSASSSGADAATGCSSVDTTRAADCDAPLVPGADRTCTMTVAGKKRELLVYAPKSWDPCKPSALVVDAHGSSETDAEQAGKEPFLDWPGGLGSGFRLVADHAGFVVAQPQGIGNAWAEDDADFALAIPAYVGKTASIDPKRVFLSGISNGGALTYWTACKDTGVFAAFAPVSAYGVTSCAAKRATPLVHFHSPDDKIVSLSDGRAAFDAWVKAHGCTGGPKPSSSFGGASGDARPLCLAAASGAWSLVPCDANAPATTCQAWSGCDGGTTATFCTVPADRENHYDKTGGHILYINATRLSLAAVAWSVFDQAGL